MIRVIFSEPWSAHSPSCRECGSYDYVRVTHETIQATKTDDNATAHYHLANVSVEDKGGPTTMYRIWFHYDGAMNEHVYQQVSFVCTDDPRVAELEAENEKLKRSRDSWGILDL